MMQFFRSRTVGALALLLLVFLMGVLGFKFMFAYSWIDAMYMTVITITTVGFGELHPMAPSEKIFTSFLILSSIFIVGYAIKVFSEYVLSSNNIRRLKKKKLKRKIDALQGHIIICGFGRNGNQAVQKLKAYDKSIVIVEKNEEIIANHSDEGLLFIHGDAIEDKNLIRAGIDNASALICALPSDADNLFIVLSARQMNQKLKIISRATEETSYDKLKLAGADNVIMPDRIGGDHMAALLVVPDLIEFLDNLAVSGNESSMNVEEIRFEKVCEDGQARALNQLDLRKKTGCSVIGYKTTEGEYIVNPAPELIMEKGSKLILIGRPDQIESLKKLYNV